MAYNIIANLGGTLTPEVVSAINAPAINSNVIELILGVFGLLILYWIFSNLWRTMFSKSESYRKLLVDMYIVGMIKKFASEDNIDLIKELKEFNKIEKRKNFSNKDIDSVIADNLKEKINAKAEQDLGKIEEN